MGLFGKRAEETAASAPDVTMAPPNGGGSFIAGARHYTVARGATFRAHGADVAELQAQGCILVQPATPARVLSREELQAQRDAAERATWRKIPFGAPKVRLLPPLAGPHRSMVVEGRPYVGEDPAPQDVPDFDAVILAANGWIRLASLGNHEDRPARVMPGDRPARVMPGDRRIERSLLAEDRELVFDGRAWRDVTTGEAA